MIVADTLQHFLPDVQPATGVLTMPVAYFIHRSEPSCDR